jgi:hypothetical protein
MQATIERVHNRANVADMEAQPFYRHLRDHFAWHVVRGSQCTKNRDEANVDIPHDVERGLHEL